jgi:hypothetical protein
MIKSLLFVFIIFAIIMLVKNFKKKEKYKYDEENPNALITGKNIAGTVYSSEPENVPGLGWIL